MVLTLFDFRSRIEYSLCQQFASNEDVKTFCERAKKSKVGVACVNPVNVKLACELLKGENIELSCNVGFPFGSHFTEIKVIETKKGVEDGATQIDMVINVGALRSRKDNVVYDDIKAVVEAAGGRVVKTIIETWVLDDEEKKRACLIAEKGGAAIVKTTTGVQTQYLKLITENPKGAVLDDIVLMRRALSPDVLIKASGGIYDLDYAFKLLKNGADQLGVSRGEELIDEFVKRYGNEVDI